MKRAEIETRLAPADTVKVKDKRTLVLFLLGLVLLCFDFWPSQGKDVGRSYHVALEQNKDQWRVLSLPAHGNPNDASAREAFSLTEYSKIYPLVPEQGVGGDAPAELSLFINRPLPINTADKETLEMLPGIGPHLANAILKELQSQGKFTRPDDLLKVPGIGPKSVQRLLPLISFE